MYNADMNEEKVISKKKSAKRSILPVQDQGEIDVGATDLDTVSVMCIAVVTKEEYDSMDVQNIAPVEVQGADGEKVVINPFLLVGSSAGTRKEALTRVQQVWDMYDKRKAEAEL